MRYACCSLGGRGGHEAGWALLRQLYLEETGQPPPPRAAAGGAPPRLALLLPLGRYQAKVLFQLRHNPGASVFLEFVGYKGTVRFHCEFWQVVSDEQTQECLKIIYGWSP